MNRNSFLAATASLPLFILLAGCAPMHDTRQSLTQQTPSSHVDSSLPAALKNGWPDSQWWKAYHDAQLDALIDNAIQHSPDMQVAEQRIQLAEAQAKAVEAQDGPQLDFSADIERQRMSAEGLMGPFAITDPAAGTTGPWYTNGTFGLTAGWDLDLWGKNRAEVTARIGAVKAREAEQEQTRQLLASGVARLYWEWQTQAALKNVLMQIEHEQQNVVTVNRELYQHGITSSVEGVETDIDASKTQQQLNDVNGKMKVIEARLSALTNTQSAALKLRQVSLPAVESQLPEGAQAIEHLIQRLGRVDVLVNNAGAMTKSAFIDMPFTQWRQIFTVDVDGAFLCAQIAARHMIKQGEGGRIINITSVHEHTPLPQASAYTAAKHALGGLTKSMALELIEHHILVNAVAPGAIATPMNDMDDSDIEPGSEPSIPIARPGSTHEIASLVAWLCSEGASYTTGQSLIVDGGFMLANPQFNAK
ncbi:SDR family oxidoreductase [Salmonella enterica]|nr:SDR family oxidoreductase [Salmonella enterica]